MRKVAIAAAGLLAAALTSSPEEATARAGGFHGGFRHSAFRGFNPGFRGPMLVRRFHNRRPVFFATGAALGLGLSSLASPYYYGSACYQVPAWAWTPYGYRRVLVTRCD